MNISYYTYQRLLLSSIDKIDAVSLNLQLIVQPPFSGSCVVISVVQLHNVSFKDNRHIWKNVDLPAGGDCYKEHWDITDNNNENKTIGVNGTNKFPSQQKWTWTFYEEIILKHLFFRLDISKSNIIVHNENNLSFLPTFEAAFVLIL